MERTFIIIKPDAVQRGLVGETIGRFERRGLKLSAMKFLQVDDALARPVMQARTKDKRQRQGDHAIDCGCPGSKKPCPGVARPIGRRSG